VDTPLGVINIVNTDQTFPVTASQSGLEVFSITSFFMADRGTLALTGAADNTFVFLVGSFFGVGFDWGVTLSGGLTPNNVLFYVGGAFTALDRADIAGTVFGQSTCSVEDDTTWAGSLICAGNINIDQRLNLNATAFNYAATEASAIPEPGTWLLLGGGLAAVAAFCRKRSRA
jgi:hypothetical protein